MMLWIIGVVFFTLFVLFILYLCFTTDAPPGRGPRTNNRPHADLQEFRNQQRFDSPFRDETISEQHPTEDRAVVVKRSLNSHTFQPGESVKNLSAALHTVKSTSSNSISSGSSRNEQPQRYKSAHWRNGMEASVRSLKESVHSAISKPKCSICLQQYEEGETISSGKNEECNHMFHEKCIIRWLQNHDECPLCRINLCLNGDPEE